MPDQLGLAVEWQQPQSQPSFAKRLATYAVAIAAAGCFYTSFIPQASAGGSSEPTLLRFKVVRGKHPSITASGMEPRSVPWNAASAAEVVHADAWVQPQSQPYPQLPLARRWNSSQPGLHVSEMPWFFKGMPFSAASSPEVVHADAFPQPQSQPQQANLANRAGRYQSAIANSGMQVRSIPFSTASANEVVHADGWGQPQSQPVFNNYAVRADRYWAACDSADGQQVSGSPAVVTTPESSWDPYFPDVLPNFLARINRYRSALDSCDGQAFSGVFTPTQAAEIAYDWLPEVGQPYPYRNVLNAAEQSTDGSVGAVSTDPEVVTEDRWHFQLPQPYPYLRRLQVAIHPAVFWAVPQNAEVVTEDRWHQPVSQPYPYRRSLSAAIQACDGSIDGGATEPISEDQESVTEDRWHQPASQPYPYLRRLLVASQPALFWNTSTSPEAVTIDRWHQPQSQPYPYRKALSAAVQASDGALDAGAAEPVSEDAEVVTADRWAQPQSQPYPAQRILRTSLQLVAFWAVPQDQEAVSEDKWHQPQSQPDFSARARQYRAVLESCDGQAFSGNFTPGAPAGGSSFPTLLRFARRTRYAQAPGFFWSGFTPAAEVVTVDKWFNATSQPYPYRHVQQTAVQIAVFWAVPQDKEVVTEDRWHQPVSQPYPAKRVLGREQQVESVVPVSTEQESVTEDKWHQPASQPYPYSRTLSAAIRSCDAESFVGLLYWTISIGTDGLLTTTSASGPQSVYVLQDPSGQCWQVSVDDDGSIVTDAIATSAVTPVILQDSAGETWEITVDTDGVLLSQLPSGAWFQPQSQPFPATPRLSEALRSTTGAVWPTVFTGTARGGASYPTLLPFRRNRRQAQAPSFFWGTFTPSGEVVSVDKWFAPASQPYPAKHALGREQQIESVEPISTQQESVTEDRWHQPQSQPYPYRRTLSREFQVEPVSAIQAPSTATAVPAGVEALSAVGSVTATGDANESPTGDSASSAVGSTSATGDANGTTSGSGATSSVGSGTVHGDANFTASGLDAFTDVGHISEEGDADALPSGLSLTSAVGTATATGTAVALPNGVAADSAVGRLAPEATVGGGVGKYHGPPLFSYGKPKPVAQVANCKTSQPKPSQYAVAQQVSVGVCSTAQYPVSRSEAVQVFGGNLSVSQAQPFKADPVATVQSEQARPSGFSSAQYAVSLRCVSEQPRVSVRAICQQSSSGSARVEQRAATRSVALSIPTLRAEVAGVQKRSIASGRAQATPQPVATGRIASTQPRQQTEGRISLTLLAHSRAEQRSQKSSATADHTDMELLRFMQAQLDEE